MSGRPGGRRMYGGVSSSSQHDLRAKRRDRDRDTDRFDDDRESGAGDGSGRSKNDDVRISRLTRLLARLDTEESFITICGQIESALKEEENQRYVSRCFQCLSPSFLEVFKGLAGLSWEATGTKRFAQLLSKICHSMETQTVKFFQWIVDIIVRSSRGSQSYVSSSAYVMESVSLHMIGMIDVEDVITFIKCIYDVLEEVGNPKIFRVLGAIFVSGTNYTSATWRNAQFHDFIDMVVGWMVDVQQSSGQFASCSELLENSKPQFMKDLGFLITLMSQLLEDLEKAIKKVQPTSMSDSEEFRKILQLMRAFTSLLTLECPLDKLVLTEFSDRLVASTLQLIRMCEPHQNMDPKYRYELLSTVNKALFFGGGVLSQSITKYFRAQLKLGSTNSSYIRWPKLFLNGFIESITVWVEAAVAQTQLLEDIVEICDVLLEFIEDMQKALPPHDQHYVMKLIIALLRTRNVNLLQKTYGWIIAKLPPLEKEQSESVEDDETVLFVLMGLSDIIGNKSSAILSLWALQPPMFEVLVDITNRKIHARTRQCSLELFKTHCNMHSHFVSSIASTGSFNTDSPGTKFLPALMDFWLEKLQDLPDPQDEWLLDWILGFLQSTNSYSSLLYKIRPDFYERFLNVISQKRSLLLPGAEILKWLCCESSYLELEQINLIIRERLLVIILDEKVSERIAKKYKEVLYHMRQLIVIPEIIFVEDCMEPEVTLEKVENDSTSALVSTEFNLFLYELLIGNSPHTPSYGFSLMISDPTDSSSLLSIAADHLIRMKLKTPIGKPQDFFAQLLLIFKRSRVTKIPVPVWKLHFVFELEKKFQLWTHGSAIDDTELTEHVRQFYLMNKSPFLEWLKKIRSEIIESCLLSQELALAYFNAALIDDTQKMELVLCRIGDLPGLKGMGNLAASCYLEGKFEEAINLIGFQEIADELSDEVKRNSQKMLQDCCTQLQKWSESETLMHQETDQLNSIDKCAQLANLLEFQLRNYRKVDLTFVEGSEILEQIKLPTIQRIHSWLKVKSHSDTESIGNEKIKLERIRMNKMVEAGNVDYVKNWLITKDVDVNSITSDEDLCNLSLTTVPVDTLKVCADYYAKKSDYRKSGILYNVLRELVTGSMDSDLAIKVTASLSSKIRQSEEFFSTFSAESLSTCTQMETVKSLHQVAVQSFPETGKAWLAYGDFVYSYAGKRNQLTSEETKALKLTTVECYEKYLQLSQQNAENAFINSKISLYLSSYSPKIVVMARLLQLFREGFQFNFQEAINTEDWLIFIAEIAQIPEMRSFIVEKYPDQVSLFFTSYDSQRVSNKFSLLRRNLFDLSPYTYVDTSEEPLSSSVVLSNLSQLEKSEDKGCDKSDHLDFKFRSNLNIPACATIFTQELLHVASSMEDMWVWSLERVAVDWTRRLTYLRKECSRALSSEKIQAFVQPILTYLNSLLSITLASQTLVDLNFVNRHKSDVQKYLDLLSGSSTLEEVASAMNSLLKYSERFGMLVNNKLPLSVFSTRLSDPEFYQSSDFSICLPGQPSHIKISSLYHMIHALPTKTKPKRIRILANNGKYYDYLVKGTENLNIDCGVMQFLKISQSFFKLPTRTYSVTPLGKRGGLIQIVPDAIPLFTLYKKHLQRNKTLEKTSEMFWRRMNSLGYDDRSSLAAQREVFETLCGETSCDLITRELLLSAKTPSQWLHSVQTFTRDCSIGSAIGYLLGIGDRHLDNMLVNTCEGKFIHVDFSIIFGKGASLRVPEKVPFRLTQNLLSVLQHPGPSGAFSVIMREVLKSFQDYRDTAIHLIRNIAFCHLYDEDSPVDLTQILVSEVEAAVKLFLCRSCQYLSLLQSLRHETLEIADQSDSARKISRKMNRWRRMLVNLNTVLQFINNVAKTDQLFVDTFAIIHKRWTSLFQMSLETGMEQQSQTGAQFLELLDTTETLLMELETVLRMSDKTVDMNMVKVRDPNIQVIDMNRVEVLVKYAEMNIQTFNPTTTVKKLIDEATNVDNLAQMYEGWTPWV